MFVGAGLAPPEKIFNYKTGRPRPTPTMSAIYFANQSHTTIYIISKGETKCKN